MTFSKAVPASQRKFPSVEIHSLTETRQVRDLGVSRILVSAFFVAEVWVRVQSAASEGLGNAKSDAWAIEREVSRIILSKATTLTDLKLSIPETFVNLDELDNPQIVLHRQCTIKAIYYES